MEPHRPSQSEIDRLYRDHARRLTLVAYRILGRWHAAEDAMSEAFARLLTHNPANPAAWLTVVTTRVALDAATSAEARRTTYIGPWLPDHVAVSNVEDEAPDVDIALVRLLQTLRPVDRAIVVLSDAAGLPSTDIAGALKLTPAAVRQRLSRARKALREHGNPTTVSTQQVETLADMLGRGELALFINELSEGAVLWTDSGGLTRAARNPIVGRDKIHRFLAGLFRKYGEPSFHTIEGIGGSMLVAESTDMTRSVFLETDGQVITGIQVQQNPHKRIRLIRS